MKHCNGPYDNLISTKEDHFEYFNIGEKFEVTINFIKSGVSIPNHTHDENVYNFVMNGEIEVMISDQKITYSKGDWMFVPANTVHSVLVRQNCQLLELWEK